MIPLVAGAGRSCRAPGDRLRNGPRLNSARAIFNVVGLLAVISKTLKDALPLVAYQNGFHLRGSAMALLHNFRTAMYWSAQNSMANNASGTDQSHDAALAYLLAFSA